MLSVCHGRPWRMYLGILADMFYDDTAIIILNIIYDKYQVRFRILKAIMACYQKCTHSVDRSKCVYQTIVHCYISSSM